MRSSTSRVTGASERTAPRIGMISIWGSFMEFPLVLALRYRCAERPAQRPRRAGRYGPKNYECGGGSCSRSAVPVPVGTAERYFVEASTLVAFLSAMVTLTL